jgi:general secretion pathway protein G
MNSYMGYVRHQMHGRHARQRGMTLIEIMVVITILGMVAAAVAVAVIPQLREARVQQARTDIMTIKNAADLYYNKHSSYPSTDEGIQALVSERFLDHMPRDPWGNPYVYRYPGVHNQDGPDIGTYGSNGQPGGTGDSQDIFLGQFER